MCKAIDDIREESLQKGQEQKVHFVANNLFKLSMSISDIAQFIGIEKGKN